MIRILSKAVYQVEDTPRVILAVEGRRPEGLSQEDQETLLALALKPGKVEWVKTLSSGQMRATLYAVLPAGFAYDDLEDLMAELASRLREQKPAQVDVLPGEGVLGAFSVAFYKQLALMADGFDRYQTSGVKPLTLGGEAEEKEVFNPEIAVYLPVGTDINQEESALREAEALAEGIRTARRLVNEPANIMTPERLAGEARQRASQFGFDIEIYDEREILQLGLQAFWSVAKGSDAPPRFIVMRYMNKPESQEVLALIGKGLTYDSGGYALKPADGMVTMFCDMGGAGAVIGAMGALARMKAEVNVVGIVAACENMVSGHAYHNGDIIGSLAGKYIEVVNTDAEGRITLADAITYAAKVIKADKIIDIATLTGAVGVALGKEITGVVADSEDIWQALSQASAESGDKIWRLPHFPHLEKANKSERADIKNSGGRMAGTATAALFCRAFAFGVPWGHLDIAGTAYQDKASAKAPHGATGVGVELLCRAAVNLFRSAAD